MTTKKTLWKKRIIAGLILSIVSIVAYAPSYCVLLPALEFVSLARLGDVIYEPLEWLRLRNDIVYYLTEEGYREVSLTIKRATKNTDYQPRYLSWERYYFITPRRLVLWDETNEKIKEHHFLGGSRHGLAFDKNIQRLRYKNGVLIGKMEIWHSNGIKAVDATMDERGVLQGKQFYFYDNGRKAYEADYCGGEIREKAWSENGEAIYEAIFIDGNAEGKYYSHFEKLPRVLRHPIMLRHLLDAPERFFPQYFDKNKVCFENLFRHLDIPSSLREKIKIFEGRFSSGLPVGTHSYFYENRQKACSVTYQDGSLFGTALVWDDNGALIRELFFSSDRAGSSAPSAGSDSSIATE